MVEERLIFRITGRFPLLQIIVLVFFGIASVLIASKIQVGVYEEYEVSIEKEKNGFLLVIPEEIKKHVDEAIGIKWSSSNTIGKKRDIIMIDQNGKRQYYIDASNLSKKDINELENNLKVYIDCKISQRQFFKNWEERVINEQSNMDKVL